MYDLLVRSRDTDLGCLIISGAIFYADDIILLSGSVVKLQAMLDI